MAKEFDLLLTKVQLNAKDSTFQERHVRRDSYNENERGETFFVGQGLGQGAGVQQYVKDYPAACGQEGQGHPPILGDCL